MNETRYHRISVSRGELHVGELGAADAPVLLVLHYGGGGFARGNWEGLQRLAEGERPMRLIRLDRRGYGLSSPRPEGFPEDFFKRDLEDLQQALEQLIPAGPFHVLGSSDGGTLALMLGAASPDRVTAVAVDGAHFRAESSMTPVLDKMEQRFIEKFGVQASTDSANRATLRAWFGGWKRLVAQGWNMEQALAEIRCPVYVLQGSEDGVVPDQHAFDLAAACGGQAEILPGGTHLSRLSHPEEYHAWLDRFLLATR